MTDGIKWVRCRKGHPCPTCNTFKDRCAVSDDGVWNLCYREGKADAKEKRDRNGNPYWVHRLNDAPPANGYRKGGSGGRNGSASRNGSGGPRRGSRRADRDVLHQVYAAFLESPQLDLTPSAITNLEGRGFPVDEAKRRGYRSYTADAQLTLTSLFNRFGLETLLSVPGFFQNARRTSIRVAGKPGLLIPIRDLKGQIIAILNGPEKRDEGSPKYFPLSSRGESKGNGPSPGAPVHVPLGIQAPAPVVRVTEGALKADLTYFLSALPTIGVPGVGNWRAVRSVLKRLKAETARIAYDTDWRTNEHVARPMVELARDLQAAGFAVEVETWPIADGKGIDDLLAAGHKPETRTGPEVETILAEAARVGKIDSERQAQPGAETSRPDDETYFESNGCTWVNRTSQGDSIPERIARFIARIAEQIERHEAGMVRRIYRIRATRFQETAEGTVDEVSTEAMVDADEYDSMGWVQAQLGPEWIIEAGRGTKDHLRAAIQVFSAADGIGKATVHTALGWIEHDGQWLYCHAGGAIGRHGTTDAIRVDPCAALAPYRLPDPPTDPGRIAAAVKARQDLLYLAVADRPSARGVAAVLLTLPVRAVLGPSDFTVQFSGPSGTLKSSAARLALDHFAYRMGGAKHQCCQSWRATLNSLQRLAYDAKDSLLVIDELTGEQAVATATEFVQCQGNLKSRDRMDRDFRVAPSLDPRCSALSTGEADPTRQSALGRMLTVRFTKETIDPTRLADRQREAADGLYAEALTAFVQWLAQPGRLEEIRTERAKRVESLTGEINAELAGCEIHPRHPGALAELLSAYELYLRFARECDGLLDLDADSSARRVRKYLTELIRDQAETQREAHPAHKFIALLVAGLKSGRFHIIDANSDNAPQPFALACGWEKKWVYQGNEIGPKLDWSTPANSKRLGFIDVPAGLTYLDPEMAKTLARSMARDQGEQFENVAKIGRDLAEAGLIHTAKAGGKIRYTLEKRIPNAGKERYYFLPIEHLFGSDAPEDAEPVATVATPDFRVATAS